MSEKNFSQRLAFLRSFKIDAKKCIGTEGYPGMDISFIECDHCGKLIYANGVGGTYYHHAVSASDLCYLCFTFIESFDSKKNEESEFFEKFFKAEKNSGLDGPKEDAKCFVCSSGVEKINETVDFSSTWRGDWCNGCFDACQFLKAPITPNGNRFIFKSALQMNPLSVEELWNLTDEQMMVMINDERVRRDLNN